MRCINCGGEFQEKSGKCIDPVYGVTVDLDCWYECATCGNRLFPFDEAMKLWDAYSQKNNKEVLNEKSS